jgi:membrane protease YdiL (CAAX protease family)
VLVGGLIIAGVLAVGAIIADWTVAADLGLNPPTQPLRTAAWTLGGLAVLLAWSPVADAIASRLTARPPTLGAFRRLQRGLPQLLLGIVAAWVLGGFLEELAFRGLLLGAAERLSAPWLGPAGAAVPGIAAAALGAGIIHLYQGPRAVIIITQLSVLFGVLFVLSGHDLWAVIACHGLYDTIAFIRFALGKSKYSKPGTAASDDS